MLRTRAVAALVLVTLALACGDGPTELDRDVGLVRVRLGTLEQSIAVVPPNPAYSDTVTLVSEVVNRGALSRMVTYRICGLDVDTELELPWPGGVCLGHSATGRVQPGDTILGYHLGVIESPPGEYALRVRHLLEPELWVDVSIVVH